MGNSLHEETRSLVTAAAAAVANGGVWPGFVVATPTRLPGAARGRPPPLGTSPARRAASARATAAPPPTPAAPPYARAGQQVCEKTCSRNPVIAIRGPGGGNSGKQMLPPPNHAGGRWRLSAPLQPHARTQSNCRAGCLSSGPLLHSRAGNTRIIKNYTSTAGVPGKSGRGISASALGQPEQQQKSLHSRRKQQETNKMGFFCRWRVRARPRLQRPRGGAPRQGRLAGRTLSGRSAGPVPLPLSRSQKSRRRRPLSRLRPG